MKIDGVSQDLITFFSKVNVMKNADPFSFSKIV